MSPHRRWWLIALHVPLLCPPVLYSVLPTAGRQVSGAWALPIAVGVLLVVLQLRHSLATVRGERPAGWALSLLALAVLALAPGVLLGWQEWAGAAALWPVQASALMLLPRRYGIAVFGCAALFNIAVYAITPGEVGYSMGWAVYALLGVVPPTVLYLAVRLARMTDELHARRAELTELAVGRERLRVSRDLHDLLGQSLSAVSLKADLALRLLPRDPVKAHEHIAGLTEHIRGAAIEITSLTRGEHPVSLATELDGAVGLLEAVGIEAAVERSLPRLAPEVERALALAVREGVTNLLRHSDAATTTISAAHREGVARLEIVNDGVRTAGGTGTGLAGLRERALALGGTVTAGPLPDDRFQLLVEITGEGR